MDELSTSKGLIWHKGLRWLGYVQNIGGRLIPKELFYGGLAEGRRPKGRPKLRYKDKLGSAILDRLQQSVKKVVVTTRCQENKKKSSYQSTDIKMSEWRFYISDDIHRPSWSFWQGNAFSSHEHRASKLTPRKYMHWQDQMLQAFHIKRWAWLIRDGTNTWQIRLHPRILYSAKGEKYFPQVHFVN